MKKVFAIFSLGVILSAVLASCGSATGHCDAYGYTGDDAPSEFTEQAS